MEIDKEINKLDIKEEPEEEVETPKPQPIKKPVLEGSESICMELNNGFKISLGSAHLSVIDLANLSVELFDHFSKTKPKQNGSSYLG